MEFVKLFCTDGYYSYKDASNIAMNVLSVFLMEDVGCSAGSRNDHFFRKWALADKGDPNCGYSHIISGNTTLLDEDDDGKTVHFTDISESIRNQPGLKMRREQLVKILDDWQEKVCKLMPKEVIIKYENDRYIIETSN